MQPERPNNCAWVISRLCPPPHPPNSRRASTSARFPHRHPLGAHCLLPYAVPQDCSRRLRGDQADFISGMESYEAQAQAPARTYDGSGIVCNADHSSWCHSRSDPPIGPQFIIASLSSQRDVFHPRLDNTRDHDQCIRQVLPWVPTACKEAGHWLDRPIIREKREGGLAICQRFFPEGACVKQKSPDRTKMPHTDTF